MEQMEIFFSHSIDQLVRRRLTEQELLHGGSLDLSRIFIENEFVNILGFIEPFLK